MKIKIELTTLTINMSPTLFSKDKVVVAGCSVVCVYVCVRQAKHSSNLQLTEEPLYAIGCHCSWFWVFFITFNSEE